MPGAFKNDNLGEAEWACMFASLRKRGEERPWSRYTGSGCLGLTSFRVSAHPGADCSATPRAGPPVMVSRMSTSHATAEWSGLGA